MKNILLIITVFIVFSCGGSGASENSSGGMEPGKLEVNVAGETFTLDVRYYLGEEEGLTMYSDSDDVTDSNGDGLIFAIFEYNGKLQFDYVNNGKRLGAQVTDWTNANGIISGKGELRPESGLGQGTPFEFSLKL